VCVCVCITYKYFIDYVYLLLVCLSNFVIPLIMALITSCLLLSVIFLLLAPLPLHLNGWIGWLYRCVSFTPSTPSYGPLLWYSGWWRFTHVSLPSWPCWWTATLYWMPSLWYVVSGNPIQSTLTLSSGDVIWYKGISSRHAVSCPLHFIHSLVHLSLSVSLSLSPLP